MIRAEHVRVLDLGEGRRHVSAASGVVATDGAIYVVADDEVGLGVFPTAGAGPGRVEALLDEVLPEDHDERKAAKPDLEALCRLPAHAGAPHGALLACGSGSAPPRHRAVHWALDAAGHLDGRPHVVELGPLYAALRRELPELNVEGATVAAGTLLLANRGNGSRREDAVVRLRLDAVLEALVAGGPLGPELVVEVERIALPDVAGHAVALSDLTTLPDGRVVVSAIGEDTDDPYEDGTFAGAGIGLLGGALLPLTPSVKVEGIAVAGDVLLLTADADDRSVAAPLLRAPLAPLLGLA